MTAQSYPNPMGTQGFAFIEYATQDFSTLKTQFEQMGFVESAATQSGDLSVFSQGDIRFIVNHRAEGFASQFSKAHGPSACGMGFRVEDANKAFELALQNDAQPADKNLTQMTGYFPAIVGIGDSLIYLVDETNLEKFKREQLISTGQDNSKDCGLQVIDHLTHNVNRGQMDAWAGFYERLFNFREIRFFDIKGQATGLVSRALCSPCNTIRIPLNESTDDDSQIEEFIRDFNGEGIQHIALTSKDIIHSVKGLRGQGVDFMDVPDTYYEMIEDRVPWHTEDVKALHEHYILIDGDKEPAGGLLLQIFTNTMLGPVFFEIIQRKGNEGFGEGNFQALFESIERDQIRRGVLQVGDQ